MVLARAEGKDRTIICILDHFPFCFLSDFKSLRLIVLRLIQKLVFFEMENLRC
jgi:hypothetical protein